MPFEYSVDEIKTYALYMCRCPKCGFNNMMADIQEICPDCGEKLFVMKGDCNEKSN